MHFTYCVNMVGFLKSDHIQTNEHSTLHYTNRELYCHIIRSLGVTVCNSYKCGKPS